MENIFQTKKGTITIITYGNYGIGTNAGSGGTRVDGIDPNKFQRIDRNLGTWRGKERETEVFAVQDGVYKIMIVESVCTSHVNSHERVAAVRVSVHGGTASIEEITCSSKKRLLTPESARSIIGREDRPEKRAYTCPECGAVHITKKA